MRWLGYCALGALLTFGSEAHAVDYRFSSVTDDAVVVIDRDTIQRLPNGRTRLEVWLVNKPPLRMGRAVSAELWEIGCADFAYRPLSGKIVSADGDSLADVGPGDYRYIKKGTVAESVGFDVCDVERGSRAPAINAFDLRTLISFSLDQYGKR